MGSFTNYTENKLLDHVFGNSTFTPPANIYGRLGLYNGGAYLPWTEAGTGGTEPPAVNGYAPVVINAWDVVVNEVHLDPTGFNVERRCWTANTNAIVWGPSVTLPWGTDNLRYAALADAATGGNVLAYYDIFTTNLHPVVDNKVLKIAAGEMKWYLESILGTGGLLVPKVFSAYLKEMLLSHLFKIATYLPPSSLYLGLTHNVVFFGNPQTYTEFSGGSYARAPATGIWNGAVTDGATGGGMVTNNAAINFPTATANWAIGPGVYRLTLFDAATGGHALMWFKDPSNELPSITSGDRLVIPAGDLQAYLN